MGAPRRILVVDDEEQIRKGLARMVTDLGHSVELAADAEEGLEKALASAPDLIITDLQLPHRTGLELVAELQERGIESTFVVLTAHGTIDSAIEATRRGVYDYLTKPVDLERLEMVILKGLERAAMRQEVIHLRREMVRSGRFQKLVGQAPSMLRLYRLIEQIAPSSAPVLITGESGTGKEVVARAIHNLSPRAATRFVAISCASIPESLLEDEFLGHEKGAFTSASSTRAGVFELAHQGTIFLDEIAEIPVGLQSKLLRVLEDGRVRRVGGEREIPIDVRVLAATNAHLDERLAEGTFREDLYFRLNVFNLHLPPLRDRTPDIPILAQSFLEEYATENGKPVVGFSSEAMEEMRRHAWPGNVRELRNAVQRAVILCPGAEVRPVDLPPAVRAGSGARPGQYRPGDPFPAVRPAFGSTPREDGSIRVAVGTPLEEVERVVILRTLEECGDNKTRAAALLGISAKTLHSKLNRYGVREDGRGIRPGGGTHPGGGSPR
jgi:two-component system, NtrC family, response regulator HydG